MTSDCPSPEHATQPSAETLAHSGPADTLPDLQPLEDLEDNNPRKLHSIPPPHFPPPPEIQPELIRYSLLELLVLITLTAVMLASIRLLGAAVFAGLTGVLGFFMLVFISLAKPTRGIIHVAWWVLLTVYLVAAVAAVLNKDL
ncbi:MAG: hypothetical protein K8T91_27660 [Planctomycetes bacterium]|nr:hypothetical protein [Planctomycetota bacterium]